GCSLSHSAARWGLSRTLNRQTPEDSVNPHKLARLTPTGRAQMIHRLQVGEPLAQVARQLHLSTTIVRRGWRRIKRRGGRGGGGPPRAPRAAAAGRPPGGGGAKPSGFGGDGTARCGSPKGSGCPCRGSLAPSGGWGLRAGAPPCPNRRCIAMSGAV